MAMSRPVGVRFDPTDGELITGYLCKMLKGEPLSGFMILEADVYGLEPCMLDWDANMMAFLKKNERYFFVHREKMSQNGNRKCPRRSLNQTGDNGGGHWKSNTWDHKILDESNRVIGWKKMLTFFRAKKGQKEWSKCEKTDYIMHEYVVAGDCSEGFQELALCRIKCNGRDKDDAEAFAGYYSMSKIGKNHRLNTSSGGFGHQQDQDEDQEITSEGGGVIAAAAAMRVDGGTDGLCCDPNDYYFDELDALLRTFDTSGD